MEVSAGIERRLVIGLIVSDEVISEVRRIWDPLVLQSAMAKRLAGWCIEYFDKYGKAPGPDIEGIFLRKLQDGLPKDIAEEIEEDILPEMSAEYARGKMNAAFLLEETRDFFNRRKIEMLLQTVQACLDEGNLADAETTIGTFHAPTIVMDGSLDMRSTEALDRMEKAISHEVEPVMRYPGAIGRLLNPSLVRDGFVAFLGPEKRGKTFTLMDLGMRAVRQGANVAFFQAGDMSESQQLRRIGIHLCKKSDRAKYCGDINYPALDCARNQLDTCSRKERMCRFGALDDFDPGPVPLVKVISRDILLDAREANAEYMPCALEGCPDFRPTVWMQSMHIADPLTGLEAKRALRRLFKSRGKIIHPKRGQFFLSTHASGTLTLKRAGSIMDAWARESGFVPDVIIFDYADLLEADGFKGEHRHKENEVWKGLRRTSQERHALVVSATQADASSYGQESLGLKNFSEDKRKFGHVTAMFGLNQDPQGRERGLGLMRLNELVVREDAIDPAAQVYVLQCLARGLPCIGSFEATAAHRK